MGFSQGADNIRLPKLSETLYDGDMSRINSNVPLNHQANVIPYIPKLEMDREHFTIEEQLGFGNFGTVYKGAAIGLFYPGSRNIVAIKTINDSVLISSKFLAPNGHDQSE